MTIIHIFNLALTDSRILATILGQYGATTLVRLNGNGSLDNAFAAVSTPAPIFTGDDNIPSYALQPDGKISACGSFRAIAGYASAGPASPTPWPRLPAPARPPLMVYPNPTSQRLTVVLPAVAPATQATTTRASLAAPYAAGPCSPSKPKPPST